ncbi:unnamed protein product [Heterobilharzia americana]|nr:unnamed protein product [Heterobilharzia americana]
MAGLNSLIEEALSDEGVISEIKSVVCSEDNNTAWGSKHQLLELLRSKGVIDMLVSKVKSKRQPKPSLKAGQLYNSSLQKYTDNFESSVEYISRNLGATLVLTLEVLQGRAFTTHLQTYEDVKFEESKVNHADLQLHISYRTSRFSSRNFRCSTEPVINQYFCFVLLSGDTNKQNDLTLEQLLVDKPISLIQIVITSTNLVTGRKSLVASTYFDWRPYFLGNSKFTEVSSNHWTTNVSVELKSTDPDCNVPAGILDLRISLICPKECVKSKCSQSNHPQDSKMSGIIHHQPCILKHLSPSITQAHFQLESTRSAERESSFTNYVRQWWRELTHLREGFFSDRIIKIFATDENGHTQFVCNYIDPLSVSFLLETPYIAARFVSSIPYEPFYGVGAGIKERWCSGLAFVSANCGDIPDHANLLCSLLLGYGLEAYVALGTSQFNMNKQIITTSLHPYAWVVVCSDDYHKITFWDSITGCRYIHIAGCCNQTIYPSPFCTIGCIYNHTSFYANIQSTDKVMDCLFNLKDSSKWRSMSSEVIQTVHKHSSLYLRKLNPPIQNLDEITIHCCENLRCLADKWRIEKLGCDNNYLWEWDNTLEQLLLPLISSYETDQKRLSNYCYHDNTGQVNDQLENDLIISSIHRYVPKDFIFKSYPIQLFHHNPQRILRSCLRSQMCRDILGCRGDHVKFALGLRIYSYAESAVVTWVIFACLYNNFHIDSQLYV